MVRAIHLECFDMFKRASRYLDAHVMDGYRFLMQNYHAGDKICLFGMLVARPALYLLTCISS